MLLGLAGDDLMVGGPGDDRLAGLAGNDRMIGGRGSDVVDYSGYFAANLRIGVSVDLARGQATGDGADTLSMFERTLGSDFDDRLFGGSGPNVLRGEAGNDVIDGRNGTDRLHGGPGRDVYYARDDTHDDIDGGPGRDSARIDPTLDRVASISRLLP